MLRGRASFLQKTRGVISPKRSLSTMTHFPSSLPVDKLNRPAVAKFVEVLEHYREQNFGQTLYSRYVKEMVSAMDANGDGKISRQELTILLHNIGILSSSSHPQTMLTEQELQDIVDELGEETSNPAEKLDKSSGSHGN